MTTYYYYIFNLTSSGTSPLLLLKCFFTAIYFGTVLYKFASLVDFVTNNTVYYRYCVLLVHPSLLLQGICSVTGLLGLYWVFWSAVI